MNMWFNPVQLATTGTLTNALQQAGGDWSQVVIDGIKVAPGLRVLVKDEPSGMPFQNGIYQVGSNSVWSFVDEAKPGKSTLLVTHGDTNWETVFRLLPNGKWVLTTKGFEKRVQAGIGDGWDDDPLSLTRC